MIQSGRRLIDQRSFFFELSNLIRSSKSIKKDMSINNPLKKENEKRNRLMFRPLGALLELCQRDYYYSIFKHSSIWVAMHHKYLASFSFSNIKLQFPWYQSHPK